MLYFADRLFELIVTISSIKPDSCIFRGLIDEYIGVKPSAYRIAHVFLGPLADESIHESAKAFLHRRSMLVSTTLVGI